MKRMMVVLVSLVMVASMLLAGCAPAATAVPATQPPAPATQAPAPATAAPATAAPATAAPACAAKGTAAIPFPSSGKTVTVAFTQEPDLVDALFSSMSYSAWVAQTTLVGLGTWDANKNLVPELATEIPTTANGDISAVRRKTAHLGRHEVYLAGSD